MKQESLNSCKCVDCGGTEVSHSSDCTYMMELHGERNNPRDNQEPQPRDEGSRGTKI